MSATMTPTPSTDDRDTTPEVEAHEDHDSSTPSLSATTRKVRRLPLKFLGLLAVLGMLVPVAAAVERFDVVADGETISLMQFDGTVGEVLDDQGIELGEGDEVTPSLPTEVTDGMVIEVVRADEFTVVVDGDTIDVVAIADDVAAVVAAAGVGDVSEAFVQPTLSTPAVDGSVVNIVRKVEYTVVADDREITVEALPGTVGEVLVGAGITIDADDEVSAELSARAVPGTPITVTRIEMVTETEEVELPNSTVEVETSDRFIGEEVVVTSGSDGRQVDTYEVRLVDGEEDSRELVSSEVEVEPVDRVIEIGTARRPEPKPEPAPTTSSSSTSGSSSSSSSSSSTSGSSSSSSDSASSAPAVPSGSVWDRLAQCESGGNWSLNVGTYDGGLQFHPTTWNAWKKPSYPEYAWQASRAQQIEAASRLQAAQGWNPWPACSDKLGLR